MQGFTSQLETVNHLAAASPGFIWMDTGEAGDAVEVFGSALVLANLSTWRSVAELSKFVHEGLHAKALARRRGWFEPATGPAYVLWWISAGQRPTLVEAKMRLNTLRTHGPTPEGFTFERPFDPPIPARMP